MPWLGQVPARQKLCLGCPTRLHSAWPGQNAEHKRKPSQSSCNEKQKENHVDLVAIFPSQSRLTTRRQPKHQKTPSLGAFVLFFFPCRDGLLIWRRQNRTKRWAFFFSAAPVRLSFIILTRAIFPGLVSRLGPASGCRHVETKCPTLKLTPMVAVRILQQLGPIYSIYSVQSQCEGCGTGSVSDV